MTSPTYRTRQPHRPVEPSPSAHAPSPRTRGNFLALLLVSIFLFSCTKQPDLAGFDLPRWRGDRGGCRGQRLAQAEPMKALRKELKGVSANDFADLFGRPDINQLADRNQKYYIYFLEPGPHCQNLKNASQARSVAIRFSAIGLATEITFQRGEP